MMELISRFLGFEIYLCADPELDPGAFLRVKREVDIPDSQSVVTADYDVEGNPLGTPLPDEGSRSLFATWFNVREASILFCVRAFLRGDPIFTIEGLH